MPNKMGREGPAAAARRPLFFACVAPCLMCAPAVAGQQIQAEPLSAEAIIQTLRGRPALMGAAKAAVVSALRKRGVVVSDITDEGVFAEIRADEQLRSAVGHELKA